VLSCTAKGGAVTIKASGGFDVTVLATPSATGSFVNPPAGQTCAVDPAGTITETPGDSTSCSDAVTVSAPDLTATKTDDVGGATTLGHSWTWKIHVTNAGTGDATFADGQTILTDSLPSSGVGYGSASVSGESGITGAANLSCSVSGSDLTCKASGGPVTIAASTGGFDVSVLATPSTIGTFANPRSGGICQVDPGGVLHESNASNNTCSDAVTVSAPDLTATKTNDVGGQTTLGGHWTWKIHVANTGNADATFTSGQTILPTTCRPRTSRTGRRACPARPAWRAQEASRARSRRMT
jgi:hypothetical protein